MRERVMRRSMAGSSRAQVFLVSAGVHEIRRVSEGC